MENNKLYDVIALVDVVRRSNLLNTDECSDFIKTVYDNHIFTNRMKVESEKFFESVTTKSYFEKIEPFLKEKEYTYNF